jgi:DNA-directed RNA polymerase subunit E'/Rpb7
MASVFNKLLCVENIKLEPVYLTIDYRDEILKRLKVKLEGKYTRHGYIKEDTINIHKILPGNVDLIGLNGYIIYMIYFHADVCNPLIGTIVNAKVINLNKFGILTSALYENENSILEIIIAKNSVNITSDSNLDEINIGDVIKVEILGKKVKFNDVKIYAIGRVVKDETLKSINNTNDNVENEEDEEFTDELIEEDLLEEPIVDEEVLVDDDDDDDDDDDIGNDDDDDGEPSGSDEKDDD